MLKPFALANVMLAACLPATRMAPAYVADTATALAPGQVAVSGVVGGAADIGGYGSGASGRIRVGVGHHQEVGVEGSVVSATTQISGGVEGYPSTTIVSRGLAARASWKDEVVPHLAVVAGVAVANATRTGGSDDIEAYFSGTSVAGDIGFIASSDSTLTAAHPAIRVTPYIGGRFTASVPATDPLRAGPPVAVVATGSVGIAWQLTRQLRAFTEGGANAVLASTPADDIHRTDFTIGVYGVVGLGWTFGH